jgi:hypothetical protein
MFCMLFIEGSHLGCFHNLRVRLQGILCFLRVGCWSPQARAFQSCTWPGSASFNYAAMAIAAVRKILSKWEQNTELCSTKSIGSRELAYMFNAVYDRIGNTNSNRQSEIEEVQRDIAVRYAKLTSELTLMMNKVQGSVQVDQKNFIKKRWTALPRTVSRYIGKSWMRAPR